MQPIDWVAGRIMGSAMRIHSALGPGFFGVYEVLLERDLVRGGFHVERQKAIGFEFEGAPLREYLRAGSCWWTAGWCIKSVEMLAPLFEKQLQAYMRLTDCRAGQLMHFDETLLKHGIKRIVNKTGRASPPPSAPPRAPREMMPASCSDVGIFVTRTT